MSDIALPENPADRALALQIGALADAADQHAAPKESTGRSAEIQDRRRPLGPVRRSWVRPMQIAAAAVIIGALGVAFVANRDDAAEIYVQSQLPPAATPVPDEDRVEQLPPVGVPEVVALPYAITEPQQIDITELTPNDRDPVVLSSSKSWLTTGGGLYSTSNRGLTWWTASHPLSIAGQRGCLNGDNTTIVGIGDIDGRPFVTFAAGIGGSTGELLTPASADGRGSFCRPAMVGDRWAMAASDGARLVVHSTADEGQSWQRHLIVLPTGVLPSGDASQGHVNLYANGDQFVAEICTVAESLCWLTTVSIPASALDDDVAPFRHQAVAGETLTEIAEAYGARLRDVLAANPGVSNPTSLAEGTPIEVPRWSEIPESSQLAIGRTVVQSHPYLFEAQGTTWRVEPVNADIDAEVRYEQAGQYAAGPLGEVMVPLPEPSAFRVDVYPGTDGAFARVWTTRPGDGDPVHAWFAWSDERGVGEWISISADPVREWWTLGESDTPVTFVELDPNGRILVIPLSG